jgi:hypothetical protein
MKINSSIFEQLFNDRPGQPKQDNRQDNHYGTAGKGHLRQSIQDKIDQTGWWEHDSKDRTAGRKRAGDKNAESEQLEKNSWERTAGKEQLGKNSWERTTGKDNWERQLGKTTWKGQLGQESVSRAAGENSWDSMSKTQKGGRDRQNMTPRTEYVDRQKTGTRQLWQAQPWQYSRDKTSGTCQRLWQWAGQPAF